MTSQEIGIQGPDREAVAETGRSGRILVVDDRKSSYERIVAMLSTEHTVEVEADPNRGAVPCRRGQFDLVIVSLGLQNFDGLRLCSQLRSLDRTRNVPILAVADADDNQHLVRGLDIGVNDYLIRPIDQNEMLARVRTQIKQKRYTERLRDNVQMSIEMAITDALTGLFNRRYMETPSGDAGRAGGGARQADCRAGSRHRFFQVDQRRRMATTPATTCYANSRCASARRSAISILPAAMAARSSSSSCRRPTWRSPRMVAERLRRRIASEPFAIQDGARKLDVTISIGIAALDGPSDNAAAILKRADTALYRAKRDGRNRVVPDAA